MGVTTWLDKIIDESTLWLTAGEAEEAKVHSSAAVLYLKYSVLCMQWGSHVRAGLSCYCAAERLSTMDASTQADWLYTEAGRLYSGIPDHGISSFDITNRTYT